MNEADYDLVLIADDEQQVPKAQALIDELNKQAGKNHRVIIVGPGHHFAQLAKEHAALNSLRSLDPCALIATITGEPV
jgi:dienelactone hydrolase